MRLFIAAEMPQNILEALSETSARLRGSVRGRYAAPDSFHVTLAFLGQVRSDDVERVAGALEAGCRDFGAFEVMLGTLGSFGRRSAATLWQGFDDAGDLQRIAGAVRDELCHRDIAFDDKKFLPHVTLMRKSDLTKGSLPSCVRATGEVSRITLFESDLSGSRPVYEPVHVVEL